MENIRAIISENLIILRKQKNYTQSALAEMLNYSDKAISRWETGESLPDYETLERICDIYDVDFSYLFTKHSSLELNEQIVRKKEKKNIIFISAITTIWTMIAVIFLFYAVVLNRYWWQLFVFGVPLSFAVVVLYNHKVYKNAKLFLPAYTILIWSTLASVFCQLIVRNPVIWTVFLIGIPLQVCASFVYYLYYHEK